MKILFKGGRIVKEDEVVEKDLLVADEFIQDILPGNSHKITEADRVYDVSGKYIMPGVIDAHTHYALDSRGTITAEDFFTGTKSAAHGGVTCFIDFSDHKEDKTLAESARERIKQAEEEAVIDFNLHQTVHYFDENIDRELRRIRDMGISSIKMFTTYKDVGYMIPERDRAELLRTCEEIGLLPTVHAEDNNIIEKSRRKLIDKAEGEENLKLKDHPDLRPAEAEEAAINRLGNIAREENLPLYIDHISSAGGRQKFEHFKDSGARIAGETTPHYLFLDKSWLEESQGEKYYMVPPLRDKADCKNLRQAIDKGIFDVVATDHCAFSMAQKRKDTNPLNMLPGIPGSETLLPLIHKLVIEEKNMSYPYLCKLLSRNPARLFGLYPQRGVISRGSYADLVIFDPEKNLKLTSENLHSAADYSPYSHITVKGFPAMTVQRGEIIMNRGEFIGERGRGKFIDAGESELL